MRSIASLIIGDQIKGIVSIVQPHSIIQSSLPIPPILGLTKKRQYLETGGERSHILTKKNPIWDLNMGGGIGGRW